jgi:putative ATPase
MTPADEEPLELFPSAARPRAAAAPEASSGPGALAPADPRAPARRPPLADRMRPRSLDEMVGQEEWVAPGAPLRALAESDALPSLILWGPPGCGKTTLARLLAGDPQRSAFVALSAVTSGVRDVRAVVETSAREAARGRRTVLFLDEIHRFNRAQQDALLPHVEHGTVTLIGATTENPSFEVIGPLLSRCRVFVLRPLDPAAIEALVRRALADPERGLGAAELEAEPEFAAALVGLADGDARRALGLLEAAAERARVRGERALSLEGLREVAGRRLLLHDRDREEHYNVVSAFIKSLRASDPDAALYWGARMLEAGEDPRFLARRMLVFASEDVGNADPSALALAVAAYEAVERIGMPEARINLGQAICYLACAPKSNAAYLGIERALDAVRSHGSPPVPLHLRNAPTPLLRELGYGQGYRYPHDAPGGFVAEPNLPDALAGSRFYEPGDTGLEAAIAARLADWRSRRGGGTGGGTSGPAGGRDG